MDSTKLSYFQVSYSDTGLHCKARACPAGAARPSCQVREQDPDSHQDRPQQQDAFSLPTSRLLFPKGDWWLGDAVNGPHLDSPV
jgi:hypothetical protein